VPAGVVYAALGFTLGVFFSFNAGASLGSLGGSAVVSSRGGGDRVGTGGGGGGAAEFDAIIVAAGGQTQSGPPPHVRERLVKAAALYHAQVKHAQAKNDAQANHGGRGVGGGGGGKAAAAAALSPPLGPLVITTAWGTPHRPCPHDAAGFERHEAADNAALLLRELGVPASRLAEEGVSLETVGNAFFARALHTDPAGLRRVAVVNSRFHMPRTRAVFDFVFGLPSGPPTTHGMQGREGGQGEGAGGGGGGGGGGGSGYELTYFAVADRLPAGVLAARRAKERLATPRFAAGGAWRRGLRTTGDMWRWLFFENGAYASKRLLLERKPLDPELLKSY
jgi:uncharacterized SAM-binding protein YcdF (DUF218 family)